MNTLPDCKQHERIFELGPLLHLSWEQTASGKICKCNCTGPKSHVYVEARRDLLTLAFRLDLFEDDWPLIKEHIRKNPELCLADEAFFKGLVESARLPDVQEEALPELEGSL